MNAKTHYINISKDRDGYHKIKHKNICHYRINLEGMIFTRYLAPVVIALTITGNNLMPDKALAGLQ